MYFEVTHQQTFNIYQKIKKYPPPRKSYYISYTYYIIQKLKMG